KRTLTYTPNFSEPPQSTPSNYNSLFFFNHTPPTEIYTTTDTLSLHDALPISHTALKSGTCSSPSKHTIASKRSARSEEHTSELQSPAVTSYAVFCLNTKTRQNTLTRGASLIQVHDHQHRHTLR